MPFLTGFGGEYDDDTDLDTPEMRHGKAAILVSMAAGEGYFDDSGTVARDFVILRQDGDVIEFKKGVTDDDVLRRLEKIPAEDLGKLSIHADKASAIEHHVGLCHTSYEYEGTASTPPESTGYSQRTPNAHSRTIEDFVKARMGYLFHGGSQTDSLSRDITIQIPGLKQVVVLWNSTRTDLIQRLNNLADENPDTRFDLMDVIR